MSESALLHGQALGLRNLMKRLSILLALLACADALLAQGAGPTLEVTRRALSQKMAGAAVSAVGSIQLGGFDYYRELDLGNQVRVIAVSGNVESGILAFRPDGSSLAVQRTGEIVWLMLFDFDGDGTAELVTEEVTGRGTGLLEKAFVVYAIGDSGVKRLWTGESYHRAVPWSTGDKPPTKEERQAFLRLDRERLAYFTPRPGGGLKETILEMRGGRLVEAKR